MQGVNFNVLLNKKVIIFYDVTQLNIIQIIFSIFMSELENESQFKQLPTKLK